MANAIVTGASRGIGRAIVEKFASEGICIWACSHNPDTELEVWYAGLAEKHGVFIRPVYFDLADEQSVSGAMKGIFAENLPVDILVNNAGIPSGGLMNMTSTGELRRVLDINFVSQVRIMQLVSRKMMRQGNGSIINMGSVGGLEARPGYLAYGSSKAALMWATRSVSKELGPYGIRVNAVAPGLVDTDMGSYKKDEEARKIISGMPIQRKGEPMEIANAVYFLASDESSFITGSIINVDGGRIV